MASSFVWSNYEDDRHEDISVDSTIEVRGYSCKLFRDDEKAFAEKTGAYLIPWNGCQELLIDRFDGRGHLHDLKLFDFENSNLTRTLTNEELALEKECDKERYMDLNTDVDELLLYEEEAVKRSKSSNGYNAVGISYDNIQSKPSSMEGCESASGSENPVLEAQPSEDGENEEGDSSDDEPFVPSPELELPENIIAPSSMKQAAVIEKTACFVARQGPQMEIVLKTKQANNPSFSFLTMGNQYNPYFKFVLRQIKMGRYHPQLQMLSHVSRSRESKKKAPKEEEKVEYNLNLPKVSTSGTSYAKLISQFKRFNKNLNNEDKDSMKSASSPMTTEISSEPNSRPDSRGVIPSSSANDEMKNSQLTSDVNQLHSNETAHPYYDYSSTSRPELPEGPVPNQVEDPEGYAKYYERWQAYYHWYYQYYSYAENNDQSQESKSEYFSTNVQASDKSDQSIKGKENVRTLQATDPGSSVSSSKPSEVSTSSEPPETIRPIIDKMAEYVARNGIDFEAMVRVKNDTRFQFLDASHSCHAYYQKRRREAELAIAASQAKRIIEEKRRQLHEELASETQCTSSEIASVVKMELSMDCSSSSSERAKLCGNEMETDDDVKKSQQASISFQFKKESVVQKPAPLAEDEEDDYNSKYDYSTSNKTQCSQGENTEKSTYVEEKEEGEISPSADDCVDEVERKLANKLAAAAREKLARVNRESVMQAERKKRAAAFMAKVRATEIGSSLASRIEKKRRAEEEREKEKEKERAAAALEIANRSREKALPAAYSVIAPMLKPVESVSSRPMTSRTRSPENSRRSHHRRDRDRDRERDRGRDRDRDRDSRRKSRSRSRDRRDHHHRSGGHNRRHERR